MTVDPVSFADEWSFDGRYYAWMGFFHGMAFFVGREVREDEAFMGSSFHADLFSAGGALYAGLDKLGPAEAEERLSFSEKLMERVRSNEARCLVERASAMKFAGLLVTCLAVVAAIASMTYGVGTGRFDIVACSFPLLLLPFIAAIIGKTLVQHHWDGKRKRMGSFKRSLPWMG